MPRLRGPAGCVLIAVAVVASCRGVVTSDEVDAVAELCQTLSDCYDPSLDCAALATQASNGEDDELVAFLAMFSEASCLQTCAESRVCFDSPLFCADVNDPCGDGTLSNCCGWSAGIAECRPDGSNTCCSRQGVACKSDSECCRSECLNGYCGGRACSVVGAACHFAQDCCSERCEEGQCAQRNCSAQGEPCKDAGECCPPAVPTEGTHVDCLENDEGKKRCQIVTEQMCLAVGDPCLVTNGDVASASCCEGTVCQIADATLDGYCVPDVVGGCKWVGFDCAEDADCCEDLICGLDVAQSYCQEPPMGCSKAGKPCEQDQDCCSGTCFSGECLQGTGVVCTSVMTHCHSPLLTGAVIGPDCNFSPCQASCIETVKDDDLFCACTGWDSVCVDRFVACAQESNCLAAGAG